MPVLQETGLPVRVIYDMGALSWAEQVQAMAESGILVAVHGAALTNVIFMPANAVLIEVFPWNYRSFLYRDLAWKAGLQYYPLASVFPDFAKLDPGLVAKRGDGVYGVYDADEYKKKCSGPHMSSMDVYSIAECTHRAKYTFPMVNIEQLKITVNDALDDIGCRDSFCHEVQFRRNDEPVIHHITDMKTKTKSQCPCEPRLQPRRARWHRAAALCRHPSCAPLALPPAPCRHPMRPLSIYLPPAKLRPCALFEECAASSWGHYAFFNRPHFLFPFLFPARAPAAAPTGSVCGAAAIYRKAVGALAKPLKAASRAKPAAGRLPPRPSVRGATGTAARAAAHGAAADAAAVE